jgi:hypothetical protein
MSRLLIGLETTFVNILASRKRSTVRLQKDLEKLLLRRWM